MTSPCLFSKKRYWNRLPSLLYFLVQQLHTQKLRDCRMLCYYWYQAFVCGIYSLLALVVRCKAQVTRDIRPVAVIEWPYYTVSSDGLQRSSFANSGCIQCYKPTGFVRVWCSGYNFIFVFIFVQYSSAVHIISSTVDA